MKPLADGEMIKECLTAVSEIGFPDNIYKLQNSNTVLWHLLRVAILAVALFLRDIYIKFIITEEFCLLIPMLGKLTGRDLYDVLKSVLGKFYNIIRKNYWYIDKFQDIKSVTGREIFVNRCIDHQESLCAKRLSFPNVTVSTIKLINCIKLRSLNHREFKELETEYGDVVFNKFIGLVEIQC